jgi:hypothetical protein
MVPARTRREKSHIVILTYPADAHTPSAAANAVSGLTKRFDSVQALAGIDSIINRPWIV